MEPNGKTVVVTGISGYVGKWVALRLLQKGYSVRGTLRAPGKREQVEASLSAHLDEIVTSRLSFAEADLLDADGWTAAFAGAAAVMHTATHVVASEPRNPEDVIRPVVEGTANVLSAAKTQGIDRVVITSSIATVGYGQDHLGGERTYTEDNWTNLDNMRWTWAYCIGKTRAECNAWDFARAKDMALTTIHPGMILGPPLDADAGVSLQLILGLLNGQTPAYPNLGFALSDVRDVADLHMAALEDEAAVGQRYLCTASYLQFSDLAAKLGAAYPDAPVPTRAVPDWLLRILVYWHRDIRQIINDIGNQKHYDGSKGRALLGREYRSTEETIRDSAEKLMELKLIPDFRTSN